MVPSKIGNKKLTYNQLRQTIQKIILSEHRDNLEVLTQEDVNLFIETYLIRSTKQ